MDQFDRIQDYISVRLQIWAAYHNHKENMSNAGFLVQMSLFGAVITKNIWPPEWVAKVIELPALGTFVVYGLLWFLIHYYTRWQLINKRISACYVAGFDDAFKELATRDGQSLNISPWEGEGRTASTWHNVLARVIYIPRGLVRTDASVAGMPWFLAEKVQKRNRSASGADSLEILITYTSLALLVLVGIKIFFG